MADRLRSGIVGAGFIGEVHARAVHAAGGVLAAVAATSRERAAAAAERLRADRSASSAEELIDADDIDIVHVCTPNHLHVPLTLRALEAGKHVICEKPLATDVAGAGRVLEAQDGLDRVTAVPFAYRFYPSVRDARERVARGEIGALTLIHGSYLQDWLAPPGSTNWRVDPALGGGSRAFGDIGVHWCDLVEFVSGQRIVRLNARTKTVGRRAGSGATEDVVTIMFETDAAATGAAVISQVSYGRKNRLVFSMDGERAALAFDQESPDWLWIGTEGHNALVARGSKESGAAAARLSVLPSGHPQGYQDCFNAFLGDVYAAIAGGQPDGLPTFDDGYRAAVLTEAAMTSASTRAWVEVPR